MKKCKSIQIQIFFDIIIVIILHPFPMRKCIVKITYYHEEIVHLLPVVMHLSAVIVHLSMHMHPSTISLLQRQKADLRNVLGKVYY